MTAPGGGFMFHARSTPDPAPLRELIARLEGRGIPCALGGSGLLAALGLADVVRDWDLTVDAPARLVYPLLDPAALRYAGCDALHADEKLELPASRIEIICGFAFFAPAGVIVLPSVVWERRDGVPLGSPEVWAAAYALLGRAEKHALLMGWLREHGARRGILDRLLAQPLPGALPADLAGLRDSAAAGR